jgi:F-type H+-transporting ATPase subunit c
VRGQISKFVVLAALVAVVCLSLAPAALAAGEEAPTPVSLGGGLVGLGAGLGVGFLVFGAGLGISRIAAAACESIARQPEAAGNISGAMILTAALIEGVALFGAIICLLVSLKVAG